LHEPAARLRRYAVAWPPRARRMPAMAWRRLTWCLLAW